MKKLIAVITLSLTLGNAFASVQWGTIKCSSIAQKDLKLMGAMLEKSAQFEKSLVSETIQLITKGKTDSNVEISRLDLKVRINQEQIAFSEFALACLGEKSVETQQEYEKEIERINNL